MSHGHTTRHSVRLGRPPPPLAPDTSAADQVAVEAPLQIQLDCNPVAVTMRTPGADRDLTVGFLFAEGILNQVEQIDRIVLGSSESADGEVTAANLIPTAGQTVELVGSLETRRGTLMTSACGVCGRQTIEDLRRRCRPLPEGPVVPVQRLFDLPPKLAQEQGLFRRTGGAHAAAVFSAGGSMRACAEDVGRHNAVDKAVGQLLLAGDLPSLGAVDPPVILLVSGRASFEIIQKAVVAGLPIVASVSAPSSLAIDLARACNVTLASFVRQRGADVFSGAERLST